MANTPIQLTGSFFKEILDSLADGVYFVDLDRRINYWNKGAERITGFTEADALGRKCMDNMLNHVDFSGTCLCTNGCPLAATMRDGMFREAEVFVNHKNGHRVPIIIKASPMKDEAGNIIGAVEVFLDNSRYISAQHQISELEIKVTRDELTGIPNRQFLNRKLESCLMEYQSHGDPFGVIFMDLDHFKLVNDQFGHDIGDKVLVAVAKTLEQNLRNTDFPGRWGGEEFLAIATNTPLEGLVRVANKIRLLVESCIIHTEGKNVRVTLSAGATIFRKDDTLETMLQRADQLMYQSKSAGRNRITVGE